MEVPGPGAGEFEWLRFEQDDVISWAQASDHVGRGAAANRLRRQRWQRPGRGVIVAHSGPAHPASTALGSGSRRRAVLAGATAATLEGLRGYDRPAIDVLIPAGRRVKPMAGVRVRRTAVLPDHHVRWVGSPPRTTVARSVVDAAAWARTDDDARAIVAAAFQQNRVLPGELEAVLTVMPRSRRRALVIETAKVAAQIHAAL